MPDPEPTLVTKVTSALTKLAEAGRRAIEDFKSDGGGGSKLAERMSSARTAIADRAAPREPSDTKPAAAGTPAPVPAAAKPVRAVPVVESPMASRVAAAKKAIATGQTSRPRPAAARAAKATRAVSTAKAPKPAAAVKPPAKVIAVKKTVAVAKAGRVAKGGSAAKMPRIKAPATTATKLAATAKGARKATKKPEAGR